MTALEKRPYSLRLFHAAFTGQMITALGVACMLRVNIGLEPWSVLQQGMSDTFGITFGIANDIVGAAVILIAVLLGESIGVGTLFCVFITGLGIDLILWLDVIPLQTSLFGGILLLLAGLELLTLGTYFYMREGLGQGSRDALMVALSKRTGKSVGLCRSCVEGLAILLGWLLGGQVGIGTVIAMLGIGALIDLNFHLLQFDPKSVRQENLIDTWRRLCRCLNRKDDLQDKN